MGETMQHLNEFLEKSANAAEMTVYCVFCPKWTATGTAAITRAASEAHRTKEHPELALKKKIVRKKRAFSTSLSKEREEQIEEERRQRMRSLGIT